MDLQATSKTNKRATIYSLQVAFNERCYRDDYVIRNYFTIGPYFITEKSVTLHNEIMLKV